MDKGFFLKMDKNIFLKLDKDFCTMMSRVSDIVRAMAVQGMMWTAFVSGIIVLTADDALAAKPEEYRKSEHRVAMRDGKRLYVSVYEPTYLSRNASDSLSENGQGARTPILLMRTPYGCRPYGSEMPGFLNDKIYKPYVEAGYIFAFNDVRGRWMSEGDGENVRPLASRPGGVDDATDAYDLIEWLVDSVPGNNGRVGVYGNSYCGYYALTAAAGRHPALRAASPQAPVCDWFIGDDMHHNGAFAILDATFFLPYLATERDHQPTTSPKMMESLVKGDSRTFFLENKAADIRRLADGRVPFLDSLCSHPDYDRFWKIRCSETFTDSLTTPMLVVGGHFDAEDLYGTLKTYRNLKQHSPSLPVTIAMGPWAHGRWRDGGKGNRLGDGFFGDEDLNAYYRDEVEFPFFDYYLRDRGEAPTIDHIFVTGLNSWYAGNFSALAGEPVSFYLNRSFGLDFEAPMDVDACVKYTSDPSDPVPYYGEDKGGSHPAEYMTAGQQFLRGRQDVLTFATEALTDTLLLAGCVEPELYVSITGTDADFVVKVIDEAPDGSEMLVRGDIFRGRYRHGFDRPEPFVPGRVEKVRFTMQDIAHAFLPGHRMKVQIQSSWFPLFDMNPQRFVDIYQATKEDYVPAEVTVYMDRERPSRVVFRRMEEGQR